MRDYEDVASWTRLLSPTRWGFIARDGATAVGFADVELDRSAKETYITYYVAPDYRHQGYGRAILAAIADYVSQHTDATCIKASVEVENVGSRRCLQAAGFKAMSKDPDGLISYVFSLKPHVSA